jgi:uncharacterized membrane protein
MRAQLSAIIQRFAAWLTIGRVGLILLLIVVPGMIINYRNNNLGTFSLGGLFAEAYNNMIWEILGVAFTVLIIDKLYQTQQERQEKKELILRLQSRDSRMVAEAANVLRTRGWLAAGALCRTNLNKARLRGLNLRLADFSEADLKDSNSKCRFHSRGFATFIMPVSANLPQVSCNCMVFRLLVPIKSQVHAAPFCSFSLWSVLHLELLLEGGQP